MNLKVIVSKAVLTEQPCFETFRKVPSICPGLRDIFKHVLGGLSSWGLYSGGLVFEGYFVFVSVYKDFKIYYHIDEISML